MSSLSFNIKNSKDLLESLLEAHEEFKKDSLSSNKAIECSTKSWHLIDWIFKEYKEIHKMISIEAFRESLYPLCPTLKIMHDIANGSKHYDLGRPKANIKETKKHRGDFSSDFSRDFDISILEIELEDGTILYFEDELEKVIEFWKSYFTSTLNINFHE